MSESLQFGKQRTDKDVVLDVRDVTMMLYELTKMLDDKILVNFYHTKILLWSFNINYQFFVICQF